MPSRFGLAECEIEVLWVVAAGRGNRAIASRTEAAAAVYRMPVLDDQ
jgi:hypothetical protein